MSHVVINFVRRRNQNTAGSIKGNRCAHNVAAAVHYHGHAQTFMTCHIY